MKLPDDHPRHLLSKRLQAFNKSEEDLLTRDGCFQDILEDWADLVQGEAGIHDNKKEA
jgi:hypothetical protein